MNYEEILKSRLFNRRSFIIGASKISILSVLIARIYYLQIVVSDKYKTLSENNSIRTIFLPASRGMIFDRNNKLLAGNQNKYGAMIEHHLNKNASSSIEKLCQLLAISPERQNIIIKTFAQKLSQKTMHPILIHSPLSWEDVVTIETNSFDLPGVYVDIGEYRNYPFGNLCSNLIGYVGAYSEDEIREKPLLKYQDTKVGKNGIEKFFDNSLIGRFGIKRVEVNAHGLNVRELSQEDAISGDNLSLTIDINLQSFIDKILFQQVGAIVVIDTIKGEILAMNSSPSYDPNIIAGGISNKEWANLTNDKNNPLINKAVSNHYPPGSTFKLIVALAALEQDISPDTYFYCNGHVLVGNRKFHCWKKTGHGHLNLTQALTQSCSCYFYNLSNKLDIDHISNMAMIFGLGSKTNIELPNEIAGFIPTKKWKTTKLKKSWNIGDTVNTSIGQGFVLATPIQLAVMVASLASGKKVSPTLKLAHDERAIFNKLPIKEKNLQIVRAAMHKAVNDIYGTSYHSRILDPAYQMAGKTGTAQVISKKTEKDDFSKKNVAWGNRNHGLFVGYAPFDQPQYACSIIIEHGMSGSEGAAPIANAIFNEIKRLKTT